MRRFMSHRSSHARFYGGFTKITGSRQIKQVLLGLHIFPILAICIACKQNHRKTGSSVQFEKPKEIEPNSPADTGITAWPADASLNTKGYDAAPSSAHENQNADDDSRTPETTIAIGATTTNGKVIWDGPGCSYLIIEAGPWYVLAEEYGSYANNGDLIEGDLIGFGFRDLKKNGSNNIRLYIENYWGTKERCFEWLQERGKCGMKR
jgi:hypothetical protein